MCLSEDNNLRSQAAMIAPRIDESESGGSNASAYDLYASFQQVPSLESSKHVLLFWCTIIEQGIRVDAPKWFRFS